MLEEAQVVLCTIPNGLAGRHHVEGEGMTGGRMAPALMTVPPLSTAMLHHTTIVPLNAQSGSLGYHFEDSNSPRACHLILRP
jgi:hypothetical protein